MIDKKVGSSKNKNKNKEKNIEKRKSFNKDKDIIQTNSLINNNNQEYEDEYDDFSDDDYSNTEIERNEIIQNNIEVPLKTKRSLYINVYKTKKEYKLLIQSSNKSIVNQVSELFRSIPVFINLDKNTIENTMVRNDKKNNLEYFRLSKELNFYYFIRLPNGKEYPLRLLYRKSSKKNLEYYNYRVFMFEYYNFDLFMNNLKFYFTDEGEKNYKNIFEQYKFYYNFDCNFELFVYWALLFSNREDLTEEKRKCELKEIISLYNDERVKKEVDYVMNNLKNILEIYGDLK
ncbi:hypothetical protein [Oceanotoga sp.]|uniref:hypothetical protein n=1 Tax=Oceanotoga sp. TaxID=2108366 RepID=UPI0028037B4F|nr:hypothetical protein [Oceanotoga sp.]